MDAKMRRTKIDKSLLSFFNTESNDSCSNEKQDKDNQGCNSVVIEDKNKRNQNSANNQNRNGKRSYKIEPESLFFFSGFTAKIFYEGNDYGINYKYGGQRKNGYGISVWCPVSKKPERKNDCKTGSKT